MDRRIGKFEIPREEFDNRERVEQIGRVFAYYRIIPIKVDYLPEKDAFGYTAIGTCFWAVKPNEEPPRYSLDKLDIKYVG